MTDKLMKLFVARPVSREKLSYKVVYSPSVVTGANNTNLFMASPISPEITIQSCL